MDGPHFDCAVEAGGQEGVGIFGITVKVRFIRMCDLRMMSIHKFNKNRRMRALT